MRSSLCGLFTLLLLVAGGCGGTQFCTDIAVPSVELLVVDESGAPITGATVMFRLRDGSEHSCDVISAPGTYTCGFETEGTLVIDVVADGYQPAQLTVEVAADECHVITEDRSVTLIADDGAA